MVANPRLEHGTLRQRLDLALSRELEGGEQVIWRGMQLARIEPKQFGIYVFAIPWTAFALFWTAMALAGVSGIATGNEAGWLAYAFPLFGTPFIAVGIGMLAAPFWPLWEQGKVLYAVTSKRVIKLRLGRALSVKSVPKDRIGAIERSEGRDGAGSLRLPVAIGNDSDGDRTTQHFQLGSVADIIGAYRAVTRLASA